ncbi:type II toxin-antitoxin system HicA family toxin [Desulfosarcina sp. OttesenSCG-928-A07]|nr:type II toxin-antitoxin system HicA family toxin [Desulfosarcina sp. OttesenSCG-928-G17]MDL2328399.1 type II toxin-antitoxin system HicA family toxin [Desulfosarcina sp. OttesenSCG-928-A07]
MRPKEVKRRLEADGWLELPGGKTSHKHFKHPTKPGKVTVPFHAKDVNPITLKNIEKQSGVSMR